jgi:hypothetical protein
MSKRKNNIKIIDDNNKNVVNNNVVINNDNNNNNNRDAPESINGFFYQRYCCINQILNNKNYEYVLEEGYEDIDFIKINNLRDIIQIKYYGDTNESLTYNSGLYKVIISNYNKTDIEKITYYAYNKHDTIYKKDLKNIFDNKKYFNIGKYLILIFYKNVKNDIKFDIRDINDIDDIYKIHINDILHTFKNNQNINQIINFFNNENNCNNYFSKYNLEEGKTFDELNKEIDEQITNIYKDFINTNNNENKLLRITLIKNCILNILTDKMFKHTEMSERQIKYEEIKKSIDEKIKIYTSSDNLYYELLKQSEKIIVNFIQKKQVKQINIESYISEIKKIKNNSLDNISFYICLLNKYYDKLNEDDTKKIKNYLITFLMCKYQINDDIDKNILFVKYLNMIVNQSKKEKRFRIPHEDLVKMIDDKSTITKFFI